MEKPRYRTSDVLIMPVEGGIAYREDSARASFQNRAQREEDARQAAELAGIFFRFNLNTLA